MAKHEVVKSSPHFNEIHTKLCKGESPYSVNKWMKESFKQDEIISVSTLRRYKNDLKINEKVETKINELKFKENELTNQEVTGRAKKEIHAENITNAVVDISAENMLGVMKVAKCFPEDYQKAKSEAEDPESKTTYKDVAAISLNANKVVNDYFKNNDQEIDVNVNLGLSEYIDDEETLRLIHESENIE